MEDIHFNIGLNKTTIILITTRNIVFINKITRNGIHFLSHILFGREHKWGQCTQFTVGPKYNEQPHYENHPTKNSNAEAVPIGLVSTSGGGGVVSL